MITIDIQEFEQNPLKILQRMREAGQVIEITDHGEAIARLVPVNPPAPSTEEMTAVLTNLKQLSAEISTHWPKGVSAQDAIDDVRREL